MKKKLLYLLLICNYIAVAQITIGSGNAVDGNAGLTSPISNWYNYSLSQTIYLASEINASGTITSLEFPLNNSNSLANSDDMITVWIGHTTKTGFNSTVDANGADVVDVASLTKVMDNGSLVKTGSNTVYTLTTPFVYNGIDNLIVVVNAAEPGDDGSTILYLQSPTATPLAMMIRSDTAVFNANNPTKKYTGTTATDSWQQKSVRPIVTINGLAPLSVSTFNTNEEYYISPNPSSNFATFNKEFTSVEVYNSIGKLVISDKNTSHINVSSLSNGIYFVNVTDENNIKKTIKFLKN